MNFLGLNLHLPVRSAWPRGLRRRSAAARLLRLWVRIPPGAWMSVCCERSVLSVRRLWDQLITQPEESYRLCLRRCVWSRNLVNEEALAKLGGGAVSPKTKKKSKFNLFRYKRTPALLTFISHYHSLWYGSWGCGYYLIHGDVQLWGPSEKEAEMITTKAVF